MASDGHYRFGPVKRQVVASLRWWAKGKAQQGTDEQLLSLVSSFEPHAHSIQVCRKEISGLIEKLDRMARTTEKAVSVFVEAATHLEMHPSVNPSQQPFCALMHLLEPTLTLLRGEAMNLDKQIEEHKTLHKLITEQKKLDLEYGHYVQKLRSMNAAPGEKVAANEHKLKTSKQALDLATQSLISRLEEVLESAPANMSGTFAVIFACEAEANMKTSHSFQEIVNSPPAWMLQAPARFSDMLEVVTKAGSVGEGGTGAGGGAGDFKVQECQKEIARLMQENETLYAELNRLRITHGTKSNSPSQLSPTPKSPSPPPTLEAPHPSAPSPAPASALEMDLLSLGDMLGGPPAQAPPQQQHQQHDQLQQQILGAYSTNTQSHSTFNSSTTHPSPTPPSNNVFSQNQYHNHPDQTSTNFGHQQLAESIFDPFTPVAQNTQPVSYQGHAYSNNSSSNNNNNNNSSSSYNNPSGSPNRQQGGFTNSSDFSQAGSGSSLPIVPAADSDPFAPVPSRSPPSPPQGGQSRDPFAPPMQAPHSQNPPQRAHSGFQQSCPPQSNDPFARRSSLPSSHDPFSQPQQSHIKHDPFAAQLNMNTQQQAQQILPSTQQQQQQFNPFAAQSSAGAIDNPFAMPQPDNPFGMSSSGPPASENPFMAQVAARSSENPFMVAQQDQSQGYNPFR